MDNDIEYIKGLLEYVRDDVRQVYLRVTAALGLAALFVTQLPLRELRALSRWTTIALFVGLALLLVSAVLNFSYLGNVHVLRTKIADYLRTGDAAGARQTWATHLEWNGGWMPNAPWGRLFRFGEITLVAGVLCLGFVLWKVVAQP